MEMQIQIFENKEFGQIRTVEIDGQIWFVGKDITAVLGYANSSEALAYHVDEEDKLNSKTLSSLGQRGGWIINESGLYSLILSSKLPAAKSFKRWVTSEVLPSLRKHGAYITDNTLDDLLKNPETAIRLFTTLKEEREKKEALLDYVEKIAPKARYYDVILKCDTAIPITVIAKDYGMTATELNKLLHSLGVQYKVDGIWVLYKKHDNQGYTVTQTHFVNERMAVVHTYWKQKGRKFIYDLLKWHGILPQIERGGDNSWQT